MVEIRKKSPLICLNDVEAQELKWLWYPYIPYGQATLLFGPGGVGKSHLTCEIAACLTRGDPLPGQKGHTPPQKVLLLSAEDDPNVILRPRMEAAGADLTRIFIPENTFVLDPRGIRELQDDMIECAATIVVIDPIVLYMGGKVDMNKMNEVRELMGALHHAAQQSGSAVVIVHHSRKAKGGSDADKAAGSVDFINSVRSAIYVSEMPDGTKVMSHAKHNYSPEGLSLTFNFDGDKLEWGGAIDRESRAAVKRDGPREKAKAFLFDLLKNGPVLAREVMASAADNEIPPATLNRAKDGLAESYAKKSPHGGADWYWRLKADNAHD